MCAYLRVDNICPYNSNRKIAKIKKHLRLQVLLTWSGWRGSNPLPPPWQGGALPDELHPHFIGASGRNRTTDTGIFSPLLYRLSYRGKNWRPGTGSNRRPLAWQASVLTNWTTGPNPSRFASGYRLTATTHIIISIRAACVKHIFKKNPKIFLLFFFCQNRPLCVIFISLLS